MYSNPCSLFETLEGRELMSATPVMQRPPRPSSTVPPIVMTNQKPVRGGDTSQSRVEMMVKEVQESQQEQSSTSGSQERSTTDGSRRAAAVAN